MLLVAYNPIMCAKFFIDKFVDEKYNEKPLEFLTTQGVLAYT